MSDQSPEEEEFRLDLSEFEFDPDDVDGEILPGHEHDNEYDPETPFVRGDLHYCSSCGLWKKIDLFRWYEDLCIDCRKDYGIE